MVKFIWTPGYLLRDFVPKIVKFLSFVKSYVRLIILINYGFKPEHRTQSLNAAFSLVNFENHDKKQPIGSLIFFGLVPFIILSLVISIALLMIRLIKVYKYQKAKNQSKYLVPISPLVYPPCFL